VVHINNTIITNLFTQKTENCLKHNNKEGRAIFQKKKQNRAHLNKDSKCIWTK